MYKEKKGRKIIKCLAELQNMFSTTCFIHSIRNRKTNSGNDTMAFHLRSETTRCKARNAPGKKDQIGT